MDRWTMRVITVAALAIASAVVPACAGRSVVPVQGSGSTFAYPLYSKWIALYARHVPGVRLNYQSSGSGAGIRQITDRTIDFGATDTAMTDEQLAKAGAPILHIPTALGAVAVVYNITAGPPQLKLTGPVLARIFAGEITDWADPAIVALNRDAPPPAGRIVVAHRSDGSGTTAVFTRFLSESSPGWKDKVGTGTAVAWPAGLGAKGNEGVTAQVKSSPGAVGYVELAYAEQNKLRVAALAGPAGTFVVPGPESVTAAAAALADRIPDDLRVSLVNAPGDTSYPISSFTYALVYETQTDALKGRALADFLWWGVHEGQAAAVPLHYAPLPAALVPRIEARIRRMNHAGRPFIGGGAPPPPAGAPAPPVPTDTAAPAGKAP